MPAGFDTHYKTEHNMWQYLNFVIHIREKPYQSLDGPEMAVYNLMARNDISFFPHAQV